MATNPGPKAFISSTTDLSDLRSSLENFFESYGFSPFLSNRPGFGENPDHSPYTSCLKILESCQVVIGIIGRRFGRKFCTGWGEYSSEYRNYSPTQAEIVHAFNMRKRLMVYVLRDVLCHYEMWKKGLIVRAGEGLNGYDDFVGTMEFIKCLENLKSGNRPSLYIVPYTDVQYIITDLRIRLATDLQIMWSHYEASDFKKTEALTKLAIAMLNPARISQIEKLVAVQMRESNIGCRLSEIVKNKKDLSDRINSFKRKVEAIQEYRKEKYFGKLVWIDSELDKLDQLEKDLKEQFMIQNIIPVLMEFLVTEGLVSPNFKTAVYAVNWA